MRVSSRCCSRCWWRPPVCEPTDHNLQQWLYARRVCSSLYWQSVLFGRCNASVAPVLESATVPGGATDGDCITVCTVDCELLGHASSWVGANFDPGALRSFRELLSQPMYFNESFLRCELLGHFWHRPMNFLGRGGSWVVTHAL